MLNRLFEVEPGWRIQCEIIRNGGVFWIGEYEARRFIADLRHT